MKFGNWNLTEGTIEWQGGGSDSFSIDRSTLLDKQQVEDAEGDLYKWILEATSQDWLLEDDLYDLNFAFVYAAGNLKDFNYEVFDRTVEYQFEILDVDDEDF